MEELDKKVEAPAEKKPKPRASAKKPQPQPQPQPQPKAEVVPPMTRGQAIAHELIRRAKANNG